jgi:hypothetical protein
LFRLITTFDEVPPSPRYDRHGTACTAPHRPHRGIGVDLKRVPPKSRPTVSAPGPIRRSCDPKIEPSLEAVRKDSAVHVSLSSDSPVKQPGTAGVPSLRDRRAVEASHPDSASGLVTLSVRSFNTGASSRRAAARRVWWLYRRGPRALSTAFMAVFLPSGSLANSGIFLRSMDQVRRPAAL